MYTKLISATVIAITLEGFVLLGQAVPSIDPGIGSLIGNLGIVGILVWYLYYHTTHTYPQMLDKFSRVEEAIRAAHSKEQEEERRLHAAEQAALRTMLLQTMHSMRSAVHDFKDTANKVVLNEAIKKKDSESGTDILKG